MDFDVLDLLVESVLPALRTFELGLHFLANISPPFEVIIANVQEAWYGQGNLYGEGARQGDPYRGAQAQGDGEEVSVFSKVEGR